MIRLIVTEPQIDVLQARRYDLDRNDAVGRFKKSVVSRTSSRNGASNLPMLSRGHFGDALTRLTRAALI
jgi:hypothetical protein